MNIDTSEEVKGECYNPKGCDDCGYYKECPLFCNPFDGGEEDATL